MTGRRHLREKLSPVTEPICFGTIWGIIYYRNGKKNVPPKRMAPDDRSLTFRVERKNHSVSKTCHTDVGDN